MQMPSIGTPIGRAWYTSSAVSLIQRAPRAEVAGLGHEQRPLIGMLSLVGVIIIHADDVQSGCPPSSGAW